ncbi:hypothetical protein [Brevibacillus massiliensis]|uniref:hypothetical protein n=1 Tax=Brevibacillus massiliensis TaxID=1118054 RepID=UPI0002DB55C7|nr:hypothetical protein [Brevibacillus massiliensis]
MGRWLFGFGTGLIAAAGVLYTGWLDEEPAGATEEELRQAAMQQQLVLLSQQEYDKLLEMSKKPQQTLEKPPVPPADQAGPPQSQPQGDALPKETAAKPDEPKPELVTVKVTPKMSSTAVARMLVSAGLLDAENRFVDKLRAEQKLNRVRTGTYQFAKGTSVEEIIRVMTTPPPK